MAVGGREVALHKIRNHVLQLDWIVRVFKQDDLEQAVVELCSQSAPVLKAADASRICDHAEDIIALYSAVAVVYPDMGGLDVRKPADTF